MEAVVEPIEQVIVSPEAAAAVPVVNEVVTPAISEGGNDATDMDDFDVAKGLVTTQKLKEDGIVKPEPAKAEVTKPLETKAEVKVEAAKPAAKVAPVKPGARDFTDIPEEDKPLFERMSNEAYAKLLPMYKESKVKDTKINELTTKLTEAQSGKPPAIPESYYEHPLAFALTPEYEQASQGLSDAQTVFNHYSRQLEAVRSGAAEYKSLTRDAKTGAIIEGPTVKADASTENALQSFFITTQLSLAKKEGELQGVQQQYSNRHKEYVSSLQQLEKTMFAPLEDPKHPLLVQVENTIKELPLAAQKNPMARTLAKALTVLGHVGKLLQDERAGKVSAAEATAKLEATKKKVGPTATGAATGAQAGAVTMDDFEAAKGRD